jgi:hypothetical protein
MSENATTEEPAGMPENTDPTEDTTTGETESTDPAEPEEREPESGSEAAKYRRKLRTTEAERDTLAERVAKMQRAEAERIATTRADHPDPRSGPRLPSLYDGSDLWRADTQLADLLDDDGDIDESKVRAAIETATEGKDHLRSDHGPRPPKPDKGQGAGMQQQHDPAQRWQQVLSGQAPRPGQTRHTR